MARVFISHSSKDKTEARRLAGDLSQHGHEVFYDEWDIKVGQCIITEIDRGLSASDFVIILLSPHSVASNWVEKEWKAKYWDEVNTGRVSVIPVLLADCTIPGLLKSKKYADLRDSYLNGFRELNDAIGGGALVKLPSPSSAAGMKRLADETAASSDPLSLIEMLSDRGTPLSKSLPAIIRHAAVVGDVELENAGRYYLLGGDHSGVQKIAEIPEYEKANLIDMYVGVKGDVNPNYLGWGGNAQLMMQHIERDEDFWLRKMAVDWPIVEIEENASRFGPGTVCRYPVPASALIANPKNPEHKYTAYFHGDAWRTVLAAMRRNVLDLLRTQCARLADTTPPK